MPGTKLILGQGSDRELGLLAAEGDGSLWEEEGRGSLSLMHVGSGGYSACLCGSVTAPYT